MIQERYVSFEVAKMLKEKGFDEPCRSYFIDDTGDYRRCAFEITDKHCSFEQLLRPTLYMTMEWLRKVHNIIINPEPVWNGKEWEYQLFIITPQNANSPYYEHNPYKSYEKCVEVGIKYTLENLI